MPHINSRCLLIPRVSRALATAVVVITSVLIMSNVIAVQKQRALERALERAMLETASSPTLEPPLTISPSPDSLPSNATTEPPEPIPAPTQAPKPKKEVLFSVTGKVYIDEDCDGIHDGGEKWLNVSTPVHLLSMPGYHQYSTTSSQTTGEFSYIGYIKEDESLTLKINVQSPYGYKSNPKFKNDTFTFTSTSVFSYLEIPQVPAGSIGTCTNT